MTNQKFQLEPEIHTQITDFCGLGDSYAKDGRYKEALHEYNNAWKLVPKPKNEWEASTWILTAMGDVAFLTGDFSSSRKALDYAMTCPGAIGNPFIHLRRGQVLLEQNEFDASADELMRAYMGGGREIFQAEDRKYLDFLGTRAQL